MRIREETLRDALRSDDPAEQIKAVQLACRHRRTDLLPDLIALLSSKDVGYFVEECLPQFGEMARPSLRSLIHDPPVSSLAYQRAAGILVLLGDTDAVPILLDALESPAVNQAYLPRLVKLAPDALGRKIAALLLARRDEIATTTDPRLAAYFAALICTLGALGAQEETVAILADLDREARDWRVQRAVRTALAAA